MMHARQIDRTPLLYDRTLILTAFALILFGLLMVATSSIVIAKQLYNQPFYYLVRQTIYLVLGLVAAGVMLRIPTAFWQRASLPVLALSFLALVVVFLPGLGHSVNGARRWIWVGVTYLQVAEFVKLGSVVYLASFLCRHQAAVLSTWAGFLKPFVVWLAMAVLLLQQPDFGTTVVILVTYFGMLFLAGVPMHRILGVVCVAAALLTLMVIYSEYRFARILTFLDPWAYQFDSGYQLTQSLIAFGRGGWLGVGLGESIQKQFYLPEAHTDFIFAVLAEELGLIGTTLVVGLYSVFVARIFIIGYNMLKIGQSFAGYLAYGIGIWFGAQALINMGVTTGLLPTKGLTLPLISAGGSSLIVACLAIAMVLRIDYERRLIHYGIKAA